MRNMDRGERVAFLNGKSDPAEMDGIELGLWLGYPPCCIIGFAARVAAIRGGQLLPEVPAPYCGTGFVPCDECLQRPPTELLAEVAVHRVCPRPFPQHDTGHAVVIECESDEAVAG